VGTVPLLPNPGESKMRRGGGDRGKRKMEKRRR
jgi:hypothetical protein